MVNITETTPSESGAISRIKKTKEVYIQKHQTAQELKNRGMSQAEIAKLVGISESTIYRWFKQKEKPKSSVTDFVNWIKENGPTNTFEIKKHFPRHNALYLTAEKRGLPIRRYVISKSRVFGDYATWYYVKGHEKNLKDKIMMLLSHFKNKFS